VTRGIVGGGSIPLKFYIKLTKLAQKRQFSVNISSQHLSRNA